MLRRAWHLSLALVYCSQALSQLLSAAVKEGDVNAEQMDAGCRLLLNNLDDYIVDAPRASQQAS